MIGFQTELFPDDRQSDEDATTRGLEKKDLYEMVAKTYFLPPFASRGVTREYILKVNSDQVFRVTTNELRHFEVDLTSEMQRKVLGLTNAILVRKLNHLLRLRGQNPLGFTEYDVPEQAWLHRVARFIDQTSLTEFFEAPVVAEPPVHNGSHSISLIYHGRLSASKWFLRHPAIKSNRRFWDTLRSISDTYKAFISLDISIEILQRELEENQRKRTMVSHSLEDMITKASLTYTAIEYPDLKPEDVIGGSANITPHMRQQLSRNSKL